MRRLWLCFGLKLAGLQAAEHELNLEEWLVNNEEELVCKSKVTRSLGKAVPYQGSYRVRLSSQQVSWYLRKLSESFKMR